MKLSLTNHFFLATFLLLAPCASAQMFIGTKMYVGSGAYVSVRFTGTTPVTLHDTLTNLGTVAMEGSQLNVNTSGIVVNENTVLCSPNISFNGGKGINRNGSLMVADSNLTLSGLSLLTNNSLSDTLFARKMVQLNGASEIRNNGLLFSDSAIVLTSTSTLQNDSGGVAARYDFTSNSTTTQFVNNSLLRVGRSYINRGNYGALTDTGTIILGDTLGNINSSLPIYRLILRGSATGIKTLQDSLFIKGSLHLQNGPLVTTSAYAVKLDSNARIQRPSFFDPLIGGRIVGTLVRQQEWNVTPVADSLYFPVGTSAFFLPLGVRNMPTTQPVGTYVVTALNPGAGATGSFDVNRVFNDTYGWRFEAFPRQPNVRVLVTAPVGGFIDTLIVAQSTSASGVYESLGVSDTITTGALQRVITSDFTPDKPFLAIGSSQQLKLSLKVYLQGRQKLVAPYTMNTSSAGYTDTLNGRFGSQVLELYRPIPDSVVDVISIALRSTPSGADIEEIPAWLMADGSIRDFRTITDTTLTFSRALLGSYYIVIKHRNHLYVMTNTALNLTRTTSGLADLTQISNIFGGGAYLPTVSGNHAAMYAGNAANGNQEVNASDQFAVVFQQGTLPSGYRLTDVNLDNITNGTDVTLVDQGSISLYFSTVP